MAMTKEERSAKAKAKREENLEASRERDRLKARRLAAERRGISLSEEDFLRPKAEPFTEDEKREKRRLNAAKWRTENPDRSREIVRDSERRRAATRAVLEGREPGKIGPPKRFTEEDHRAKRKAKSEKHNAAHLDEVREKARIREAAKRAGTFVSKALPRLTDEERRLVNVAMGANRRARVRNAGGTFTREDIAQLLIDQKGLCAICDKPFGPDGYHIDHWKPLVRGGTNDPSNLKLTHPVCNLKKGARLPDELGLLPPESGKET